MWQVIIDVLVCIPQFPGFHELKISQTLFNAPAHIQAAAPVDVPPPVQKLLMTQSLLGFGDGSSADSVEDELKPDFVFPGDFVTDFPGASSSVPSSTSSVLGWFNS